MMNKVIVDCDNTMGLPKKPIDDGQTLLYLMGRDDIEIAGITTVFGNGRVEEVYDATKELLKNTGKESIPLLPGAGDAGNTAENNEAARFLTETVSQYPGEITILAIGVMTNLKNALAIDQDFFKKVKQVVAMGGYLYTIPLRGWNKVHELNLSSDPDGAFMLLNSSSGVQCPITLMNAHICLQAPFGLKELAPIAEYDRKTYFVLKEYLLSCVEQLGRPEDYLWDLLPAVYISYPELFNTNIVEICSNLEDLENGILKVCSSTGESMAAERNTVNMPDYIKDIDKFYDILYSAWRKAIPDY